MGKRKNGSTVNYKAKSILDSLEDATGDLLLQRYRKLCHLVGDEVAGAAINESTKDAIKVAHDNKYHPDPTKGDKQKGGEVVGRRHLRTQTA